MAKRFMREAAEEVNEVTDCSMNRGSINGRIEFIQIDIK